MLKDPSVLDSALVTQFKELVALIPAERIRTTLDPFAIWYVLRDGYGEPVITNRKYDNKYMHDFDKETKENVEVLVSVIERALFFSDDNNRLHLNVLSKYYPTEEELRKLYEKYGFTSLEAFPPGGVRFALPQMLGLLYLNNSIHRQGVKRFYRKDCERDACVQRDLLILSWMCLKVINDGKQLL